MLKIPLSFCLVKIFLKTVKTDFQQKKSWNWRLFYNIPPFWECQCSRNPAPQNPFSPKFLCPHHPTTLQNWKLFFQFPLVPFLGPWNLVFYNAVVVSLCLLIFLHSRKNALHLHFCMVFWVLACQKNFLCWAPFRPQTCVFFTFWWGEGHFCILKNARKHY